MLESQQQGRLVVLDLNEVLPTVLHDVRARGPLGEQRIARDRHTGHFELAEQGTAWVSSFSRSPMASWASTAPRRLAKALSR